MKVFVTGASGFVGSAIVQELLSAGHQVLALVRSEASAQTLVAAGAEAHLGTLEDLDSLTRGAAASDGVIHTAFNHDFSKFVKNCEMDQCAIEALGEALQGSNRPLLVTSGVALLTPGRVATEEDAPPPTSASYPRASEAAADALAARGVNASVVRLSPSVHGDGDHGFVPMLLGIAQEKGVSAYIGDGANRWPGVHRLDAARLYRLALEKGTSGVRYHGVADEGIPTREIAEAIGRGLNLPVVSKSPEEAAEHFGFLGFFFGLDAPASSMLTQERLDWHPTHTALLPDLDHGTYFKG
jgi:nucleoside-diphosphate-sugar epimerase